MEFASVALNSLLPKLFQLLHGEYKLQKDVRKGIQFLHDELRTMHAALEKVGEVPVEQLDNLQRIWAQNVRDLSYDMEDIVDTFMVEVAGSDPPGKRSAKRIIKMLIRKVTKAMDRREIAQEIKDIRERVKEVAERRDRYNFDTIPPANRTLADPRLRALYTNATELVGIGKAKAEVIKRLAMGDDGHKNKIIVSIAGFGGLGKTTLAKAVYDEIGGQFDCKAFVSVSRNLDAKKFFKDMLYALDKEKFKDIHSTMLGDEHLIDEIIDLIQNKRYLIVIDDIWDIKHWEVIVLALVEKNMSSRIITTTRIIDVAKEVGGCYMLEPLSLENSEKLFHGRIFGSKDNCKREFLDVSKKILKKCGGVPLAIVTTSSLLANKSDNIKEWHGVCASIGSGLEKKPGMDSMMKILLLSYYDLPSHLKTCLLYLSIFPEDYVIRKDRLIWRWVAEGFIQDQEAGDQSFLGMGESYFNELVNRSLIQAAHKDVEGTPACRVHDAVLDLIFSLSKEECFITTISGDGKLSLGRSKQEVRRLSMHSYIAWPTVNMPKLRSLTIFEPASVIRSDDVEIGLMPSLSCYLLRVLDLRDYKLKDIASLGFLGSLSHLRYLGLSSSACSEIDYRDDWLPVEIGKLHFLQTLDISQTEIKEVPSSITTGLRRLMCLRGGSGVGFRHSITRLSTGLKDLTSLEVLESAAVASERIAKELGYLTRLRVLEISVSIIPHLMHSNIDGDDNEWNVCTNALVESLGKLKKIESLHICDNYLKILCYDGSMEEPLVNMRMLRIDRARVVPTRIEPASLPGLTHLNIWVYQERKADIQVLGTLRYLRHLRLRVIKKSLERCVVGPRAFPCLVRCEININGGFVPSMLPRDAMPNLEDFIFKIKRKQFLGGGESTTVDDLALGHLQLLRSVTVMGLYDYPNDDKATKDKIKSAREKLEHEAAVHPNRPLRLEITRWD